VEENEDKNKKRKIHVEDNEDKNKKEKNTRGR
jgi:hypothetical protein